MKAVLLRVGIDSGSGGIQGPLFADGIFDFVPISAGRGRDGRTFGNTVGRHRRTFVEYFPERLRAADTAGLSVIGYFEVEVASEARAFTDPELLGLFAANAHVRDRSVLAEQRDDLVLVKGSPRSRLLEKAALISEVGADRDGRPLKILSKEMRPVFGDFDGRVSL